MVKVIFKRLVREFRQHIFRYIALLLLIMAGVYVIVSMAGAAETIIHGSDSNLETSRCEDGEFAVFFPYTTEQEDNLRKEGISLERKFYCDFKINEDKKGGSGESTIRVMKNRTDINLITLDEGQLAKNKGEAVLEKRYASENGYKVGDKITVTGKTMVITGIGSVTDYDLPIKNRTDVVADSRKFGLMFVSDDEYDELKSRGKQVESYSYAYRLNGAMTYGQLKEKLQNIPFDYKQVNDVFYKESLADTVGKKDEFIDGLSKIKKSSMDLNDALKELSNSGKDLNINSDELVQEMYSGILDGYTQMAAAYDEVFQTLYDDGISQLFAEDEEEMAAQYSQELQQMYKMAAQNILSAVNNEMSNIREEMSASLSEINSAMNDYANGVTSVYDADSEFNNGVIKLNDEINSSIDNIVKVKLNNVLDFVQSEDNARIEGAKNDIMMYRSGGLFAGVIVLMLFAYVMSVFVLNQINEECGVIGALYAMGVKKKTLMLQYISLPVLIAFVGGCIGLVCGFSQLGVGILLSDSFSYYSVPDFPYVHSAYLIIYGCVMPPLIAFVVNYIMINKKLSQTALSLMRNEQKTGRVKNLKFRIKRFILNYQVRQTIREIRTALAVVAGMFIALVILMLGLNEYAVCHNQKNETISQTKYQYMYSLKYKPKNVPEGATPYIMENLAMNKYGFNTQINVVGIGNDDPYYGGIHPDKSRSEIVVSKAFASKYSLSEGEQFILSDNVTGTNYAFTIASVVDYSADLSVFMNIDSMRELFGYEKDDYNVLLSDRQLDIEAGRVYSITTYDDVVRSATIVATMMNTLISILIISAALILVIVMYLLMNVMIDRARFGVSLVKVFGFRMKEIKRMYLTTHRIIIYASIIIGLPLAKLITKELLPMLFSTVSSGINTSLAWYYYAVVIAIIIVIHEIINMTLVRKINKVTPAEVLKRRD